MGEIPIKRRFVVYLTGVIPKSELILIELTHALVEQQIEDDRNSTILYLLF
ncbi:hypothetical protein [Bacillus sp. EAC]|uniref:hypothetical protein n=1 Tax=Bacillus sp. EAC TaxID=1978338 RepID=UPI001C4F40B2|nr:hypothetical protein [Bacillus sp. EAC]